MAFSACNFNSQKNKKEKTQNKMTINKRDFLVKLIKQKIFIYTLVNKNGITAKITNYGGI